MELHDFLLQRIAEDEVAANTAIGYESRVYWEDAASARHLRAQSLHHYMRHDPARVLAECERKRRIVERCAAILAYDDWEYSDTPTLAEATLSDLAAIWADHPDYREEWRP